MTFAVTADSPVMMTVYGESFHAKRESTGRYVLFSEAIIYSFVSSFLTFFLYGNGKKIASFQVLTLMNRGKFLKLKLKIKARCGDNITSAGTDCSPLLFVCRLDFAFKTRCLSLFYLISKPILGSEIFVGSK